MHADLVWRVVAEDEVGVERQIERAHVERVGERRPAVLGALGVDVDGAAETGIVVDHVMLAQRLAGRRFRVHDGHVVGLNKVLDQEFPIRVDGAEVELDQRRHGAEVDVAEPGDQRREMVLDRRRGALPD